MWYSLILKGPFQQMSTECQLSLFNATTMNNSKAEKIHLNRFALSLQRKNMRTYNKHVPIFNIVGLVPPSSRPSGRTFCSLIKRNG